MLAKNTAVAAITLSAAQTAEEKRNEILNNHQLGEHYLEYIRAHYFPDNLQPPITIDNNLVTDKAYSLELMHEYINLGPNRDNISSVPPSSLPQGTITLAVVPQPDGQPAVTNTVVQPVTAPQPVVSNTVVAQPAPESAPQPVVTPQAVAVNAAPTQATPVAPVSDAPQPVATTAAQTDVTPTPVPQSAVNASVVSEIKQVENDINTQVNKGVAGTTAGALRDAVPTNILNDNINAAAEIDAVNLTGNLAPVDVDHVDA